MKPVPPINQDTAEYWDAAKAQRLIYKVCTACGHTLSYPRAVCPSCQSVDLEFKESAGHGEVATFSIVHRAPNQAFRADAPYVLALVDFAEGFRLMMNVVGEGAHDTQIGDAVQVVFEDRGDDGAKVPQVERVSAA